MKKSMWKRSWMPAPMDSQGAVFGITETENDREARPKSLPEEQGQGRRPSRQSGILTGVAIPKMSGSQVDSEQIWQSIYAQFDEQENQAGEPGPLQEEHDAATKMFHSSEPAECITVTTPDLPISPTQASSGQSSTSSLYDIEEKGKGGGDLPMLLSYTADDVASKKITGTIAVSAEMMIVDDFESLESSGEEHDDEETDEKSEAVEDEEEEEEEEEEGKEEAATVKKYNVDNASETSDNEYNETIMISITTDPAEPYNKESNSDEEAEAVTAVMPNREDANLQSLSESQVALPLHSEAKENTAVGNEENDDNICYEKKNEDEVEQKQINEEEAERGTKVDSNSVSETSIVAHIIHTATGGDTHEESNTEAQSIDEVKIAQEVLGFEVHTNESPSNDNKTGISPSTTVSHTSATFPDTESSESTSDSEEETFNAEKKHASLGYRTEEENKTTIQEPLHIPVRELTVLQTPNTNEEKQPAPPITLEMDKKPEAATSVMHLEAQNVIVTLASGSPSQQFNPTALPSTYYVPPVQPVQPVPTLQAASSQVQDAPYFPQIQNPTPPSMTTVPPPQPQKALVPQCVPQIAHLEASNLQANAANTAQIPPQLQVRASQSQSSDINLQGGASQVHSQVSWTQEALPTQENKTELQANDAAPQEQVTPQTPLSHSQSSSPTKQSTPGGPNDSPQRANEPPDDKPPTVIEPWMREAYINIFNDFKEEIKESGKGTKEVTKSRKCASLCCQSYKMNPKVYMPKELTSRRRQPPKRSKAMKSEHDSEIMLATADSCDPEAATNEKKEDTYANVITTQKTDQVVRVGAKAIVQNTVFNLYTNSPLGATVKDCAVYAGFGFTLIMLILSVIFLALDVSETQCGMKECKRRVNSLGVAEVFFSIFGLIFTSIDVAIHTKERWLCKTCKEWEEWKKSDASAYLTQARVTTPYKTPDKANDDDSDQPCAVCSCCRERTRKIMDITRTMIMDAFFYPALIIAVFQLVSEVELEGKPHPVTVLLFIVGSLGDFLTVYVIRVFMLFGSLFTLAKLRFITGSKKEIIMTAFFQFMFVLYSVGNMLTQIMMIFAIAFTFKHEVAQACINETVTMMQNNCTINCKNMTCEDACRQNASKIKCEDIKIINETKEWRNLDYEVSSNLTYMMIIGFLLPIIGTLMFFIVHKFWTYKLPLDIVLDIIHITRQRGIIESTYFVKDTAKEVQESADVVFTHWTESKVELDVKKYSSLRFSEQFLHPFMSPIHVVLCFGYMSLLIAFAACSSWDGRGLVGFNLFAILFVGTVNIYAASIFLFWVMVIFIVLMIIATIIILYFLVTFSPAARRNRGRY